MNSYLIGTEILGAAPGPLLDPYAPQPPPVLDPYASPPPFTISQTPSTRATATPFTVASPPSFTISQTPSTRATATPFVDASPPMGAPQFAITKVTEPPREDFLSRRDLGGLPNWTLVAGGVLLGGLGLLLVLRRRRGPVGEVK